MNLRNEHELLATREKLKLLEQQFAAHDRQQPNVDLARELSKRSLKKLINQLKEEIARFDA
jgi:hypothetical protein